MTRALAIIAALAATAVAYEVGTWGVVAWQNQRG